MQALLIKQKITPKLQFVQLIAESPRELYPLKPNAFSRVNKANRRPEESLAVKLTGIRNRPAGYASRKMVK